MSAYCLNLHARSWSSEEEAIGRRQKGRADELVQLRNRCGLFDFAAGSIWMVQVADEVSGVSPGQHFLHLLRQRRSRIRLLDEPSQAFAREALYRFHFVIAAGQQHLHARIQHLQLA